MRALFDSAAALCRRRSWSPPLVWLGATEGRCVGRCVECAPGPGSKMGRRGIWDGTATGKRVGPHHGHLGRGGRVAPTVVGRRGPPGLAAPWSELYALRGKGRIQRQVMLLPVSDMPKHRQPERGYFSLPSNATARQEWFSAMGLEDQGGRHVQEG